MKKSIIYDVLIVAGIAAQDWGLVAMYGAPLAAVVIGSELLLMGIVGALRDIQ